MQYHFKVHKEGKGYWAECIELKGCLTDADSMAELKAHMEEALNLYLSEPNGSTLVFPLPKRRVVGKNVVLVSVRPWVALAFMVRRIRLLHGWTQRRAAEEMNIKSLWTYQKLESPKTANPEFKTLAKIKKAFPELEIDELLEEDAG